MRIHSIVGIILALGTGACTDIDVIPKGLVGDGGSCPNPTPPDLAMAQPTCKAAAGISGTPLICQDFVGSSVPTIEQLTQKGWNFDKATANCWQIQSSLNVKNFGSASGICAFTLPEQDLNSNSNKDFKSVTLSIIYQIDMVPNVHRGEILLDLDVPERLIHQVTGEQKFPVRIKTNLPLMKDSLTNGKATFYLKASSQNALNIRNGWQIESIAVVASP